MMMMMMDDDGGHGDHDGDGGGGSDGEQQLKIIIARIECVFSFFCEFFLSVCCNLDEILNVQHHLSITNTIVISFQQGHYQVSPNHKPNVIRSPKFDESTTTT